MLATRSSIIARVDIARQLAIEVLIWGLKVLGGAQRLRGQTSREVMQYHKARLYKAVCTVYSIWLSKNRSYEVGSSVNRMLQLPSIQACAISLVDVNDVVGVELCSTDGACGFFG